VVINDSHITCVTVFPCETYPPLFVDTDTPLSGTIPRQQFETIAGWHAQFLNSAHGINQLEFPPGYLLNVMRKLPGKYRYSGFVSK